MFFLPIIRSNCTVSIAPLPFASGYSTATDPQLPPYRILPRKCETISYKTYLFIAAHVHQEHSNHHEQEGSAVRTEDEVEDRSQQVVCCKQTQPVEDPFFGVVFGVDGSEKRHEIGYDEGRHEDEEEDKTVGPSVSYSLSYQGFNVLHNNLIFIYHISILSYICS